MQGNINIPDSTITTNLSFRQLVLMNMQQLTNFPYIEKDFDALTDYELLCLVVKYLNDVIANQNEQNDSITRMYESFLALQTYVNNTKDTLEDAFNNLDDYVRNYFDNLDVQEEINNKLDQMLEDGVLGQIIEQFLQSTAVWCFDNVNDMKVATNLVNGSYAKTLGYYSVNDGGGATYKITSTESQTEYQEELNSGLYATLIIENEIIPLQLGAKGNGTNDDTSKLQLAVTNFNIINGLNKTYLISDVLTLKDNIEIKNCKIKGNNSLTGLTGDKLQNVYIHDCEFNTFKKAIELSCYWSTFNHITFYECGECFYMKNGTASGNLVENKYMNCDAQNVGRFLLIPTGNKLTDSFIKNININCNDSSKNAINIGSGAGHIIDTLHIYGSTNIPLSLSNAYNTSISNVYIENYETNALYISAQLSVNLNNLIITAKNNKNIIVIEKEGTSYFTDVCVNINNLMINGTNAISPTNVIYSGTSPKTQISNISVDSSYTLNGFYAKGNLLINNHFISMADKQLFVENRQLQTEKIEYMAGAAKTSTIPILIRSYAQRYFHVTFLYTSWLGGTTLNKIETDVLISRPNDNDVVITKTNANIPLTISYDKTNQIASFTYTPADNDQYGNLVIKY